MAGKNVIICLDGTGNQFKEHNSNVVKLFRVLPRDPKTQVCFYDPGVGTLADPDYKTPVTKRINKAFGLAFGRGLTRNVEEAYSYLMEHYKEGDRLFLFGFSRGAYTIRVLAGLIHCCGLLEQGCQSLIPYAMELYKAGEELDFSILGKFKATYARKYPVDIHFLGLWDTVSTFGWIYNPITLPYTTNNTSVKAVRHALAIDERRVFFRPNFWGTKNLCDIKEVWFAGVHSDVGGGYPEKDSGLAKIALEWMIGEAHPFGLQVDKERFQKYILGTLNEKQYKNYVGPDSAGKQHKSLRGPWWVAEYLPQRVWDSELKIRKWQLIPSPSNPRTISSGSTLHHSVVARMKEGGYTPINLPSVDEIEKVFNIESTHKLDEIE